MEILQEQAHKLLYLVLLLCGVVTTQRASYGIEAIEC